MNQNEACDHRGLTALLAFLAGAATGAVVMALTSPKSGPELREDLEQFGRRLRGKAEDLASQAKGAAAEAADKVTGH
jgi:gas vesicle protein